MFGGVLCYTLQAQHLVFGLEVLHLRGLIHFSFSFGGGSCVYGRSPRQWIFRSMKALTKVWKQPKFDPSELSFSKTDGF